MHLHLKGLLQTAGNWQTSTWMPRVPAIRDLPGLERGDHFEEAGW